MTAGRRPAARTPPAPGGARDLALAALVRVEGGGWAHLVVPAVLRGSTLPARDRAHVVDLVQGTVRMRRALDHLLAPRVDRPLASLDADVRAALRLGAYQLVRGVPPHAAVGETVGAAARRRPGARGLVNAVLRRLAADGPPWPWPAGDSPEALGVRTSHPDWIVRRLVDDLGPADAAAVLAADTEAPAMTLRPNPARTTAGLLAEELRAAGAQVAHGDLVPDALVVRAAGDPAALPAVVEGRATPQDQASQAVVALVGAGPGHRVLDVAAAPGGKATGLAELVGPQGLVVAADVHPGRLALVTRAARRLGLGSVAPLVADGRRPPLRAGAFDRVLLDAPCTGLGVLRRRPDARWRVREEDVDRLAGLQRLLLAGVAPLVAPGGRLVYSVCTLTAAETLGVDAWAGDALPGFEAQAPPGAPWRPWGRGAVLLPHVAGTDGMFVLVLRAPPGVDRGGVPGTLAR